jgi:hypothetical protein
LQDFGFDETNSLKSEIAALQEKLTEEMHTSKQARAHALKEERASHQQELALLKASHESALKDSLDELKTQAKAAEKALKKEKSRHARVVQEQQEKEKALLERIRAESGRALQERDTAHQGMLQQLQSRLAGIEKSIDKHQDSLQAAEPELVALLFQEQEAKSRETQSLEASVKEKDAALSELMEEKELLTA